MVRQFFTKKSGRGALFFCLKLAWLE